MDLKIKKCNEKDAEEEGGKLLILSKSIKESSIMRRRKELEEKNEVAEEALLSLPIADNSKINKSFLYYLRNLGVNLIFVHFYKSSERERCG